MTIYADTPQAGYYLTPKVKDGAPMPVRIWFAPTADPDFPDNPMDRSPHWQALLNGQEVPIERVWPYCDRHRIEDKPDWPAEAEYRFRLDAAAWDRLNDPSAPAANPDKPVDLHSARPIF